METPPQTFRPRFLPRDKYDWRLSTAVVLLTLPPIGLLAALWFGVIPLLVQTLTQSVFVGFLSFLAAWCAWVTYFTQLAVAKVEVGSAGIRYWRGIRSYTVRWEEVEAVEEVSRADMFRTTFNPGLLTGKFYSAASLTLADYVRIRHRGGALLFPAEEKAVFLKAIRARRSAALAPATVASSVPNVLPVRTVTEAPTTDESATVGKRWYHTAYALREENKNSVHNTNR